MTRRLSAIAVAVFAVGLVACSNPCTNACSRITRCVDVKGMDMVGCRYICERLETKMEKHPQSEQQFDRFVACSENLNYRDRGACSGEFTKCSSYIPPRLWRQTMHEAQKMRQGR